MRDDEHPIEPGSDIDLAIERALAAANLRAGDATSTAVSVVGVDHDLSAAEAGDAGGGADGD